MNETCIVCKRPIKENTFYTLEDLWYCLTDQLIPRGLVEVSSTKTLVIDEDSLKTIEFTTPDLVCKECYEKLCKEVRK